MEKVFQLPNVIDQNIEMRQRSARAPVSALIDRKDRGTVAYEIFGNLCIALSVLAHAMDYSDDEPRSRVSAP
jgi:hypothetical protein